MHMRSIVALLGTVVGGAVACSTHRGALLDRGGPQEFATLYDVRGEVSPLDESSALPEALNIPSLRTQPLRRGDREIRIYTGLVIGYPHNVLIVRQSGGVDGPVSGRLARYWPTNDTSFHSEIDMAQRYASMEARHCERPHSGAQAGACYIRLRREPNWRALLAQLDTIDAWSLPDESKVPHRGMVIDGWVLRVEARRDTSYHRYQYHNPQIYRPPEGANATRLMAIVDSLFALAR
jgi:hypothetical protein